MNKYNQKETMLAEALEEKEQRIKELTDKIDVLTKENKALSTELKSLSEKPTESPKSMVTWEDFQKEINAYKKRGGELAGQYFDLKSKYDKLCEERRYWATQQWAKHLFRWLFLKRHWFFWGLYTFFLCIIGISMYQNDALREENHRLQSAEMKYRFIRALNVAPLTLQYLDDAFEGGDDRKFQIVHSTVRDYEKALIQKSDSIIRAERKKKEDLQ